MNLLGFTFFLLISTLMMALPRRVAGAAVFMAMIYITQGQWVDIAGFHFTAMRLVLLVGMLRAFASGWFQELEYNSIDRSIVLFVSVLTAVAFIRCRTVGILVYSTGMIYNIFLSHFLFRVLVRNLQELEDFLKVILIVSIPFALTMFSESNNGQNFFSAFGGVTAVDGFRNGHYRACSAFRSPITAGTYGATLLPIYLGLLLTGRKRGVALCGIVISVIIVISARSSGPLLAAGCGILGWLFWKVRDRITTLRRIFWGVIIGLHFYMKAPVWFLMGRISDIVGGGGYHRAEIVDAAVTHFSRWCWVGTDETADWMATQISEGGADLTNEFVVYAVYGGLISLILFVMIIVRVFRFLGLARKALAGVNSVEEKMIWGLGCAMFATQVNFFSVSYFDQVHVLWHFLLAACASCSFNALNHPEEFIEEPAQEELSVEKVPDQDIFVETF
jgi:hypothetical protein